MALYSARRHARVRGQWPVHATYSPAYIGGLYSQSTPTVMIGGGGSYDWLYYGYGDRLIDWSNAGVWYNAPAPTRPWEGVHGIPTFPVGITMQNTNPAGAYYINPDGVTDCTSALQAALNACPLYSAVYVPAGNYYGPTSSVSLPSFVVLRGAGPGETIFYPTATPTAVTFSISGTGTSSGVADAGTGPDALNTSGPLVSGYEKGSRTVVLQHSAVAANLAVGYLIVINQLNDPDFVSETGHSGTCSWAMGGGTRAMGEVKMISAISGTSITFSEPLWYNYEAAFQPKLCRISTGNKTNAGIEQLTIDGINGGGYIVNYMACAHCWTRNVELKNTNSQNMRMSFNYGCEVTRNYFHDARAFTSSAGYGIGSTYNASYNYIYDNIFNWVHVGVALGSAGSTANVVAYNYGHSTSHYVPGWFMSTIGCHGAHTYMNMEEGNNAGRFLADGYWGTGSHLFFFRNYMSGITNNPAVVSNLVAIEIERFNQYDSAMGNIIGHPGETTYYYEIGVDNNDATRPTCWKRGYSNGSEPPGTPQATTLSTMVRHGNYDYSHNSVYDWMSGVSHDLPPSLYLDAKPSWFGSLAWPPFGPDVSGLVSTIPAKQRWDNYQISGTLSDIFADTP